MKALQKKVKITENSSVAPGYYLMVVDSGGIAEGALPGQFVMLKANSGSAPLLRRPLGIHRLKSGRLEFLYQVVGPATEILAQKRSGEFLDILGPLGNGFDLSPVLEGRRPILVAGGMGVAPLTFLAEKLSKEKPLVLLGARTKSAILCEKEFKAFGCGVLVATDDGSKGFKGFVTDLLANVLLTAGKAQAVTVYACGPKPMLKATGLVAADCGVFAEFSLEAHMACGIGACLGCVVETKSGYKRVCAEGPVFKSNEIVW